MPKYESLYRFTYNPQQYTGLNSPPIDYLEPRHQKLFELCAKYRLAFRIKRFIPDDFRKTNYTIAEAFLNEAYGLQMSGKQAKALYWAGQNIQQLKESIIEIARRGDLAGIKGIDQEILQRLKAILPEKLGGDQAELFRW